MRISYRNGSLLTSNFCLFSITGILENFMVSLPVSLAGSPPFIGLFVSIVRSLPSLGLCVSLAGSPPFIGLFVSLLASLPFLVLFVSLLGGVINS